MTLDIFVDRTRRRFYVTIRVIIESQKNEENTP